MFIVEFYSLYKTTIDNFAISLIAALVFSCVFTWIPYWRKKKVLNPVISRLMTRLNFSLGFLVQEVFFNSEDTDKEAFYNAIFNILNKTSSIKKLMKRNGISSANFPTFYKELNSPTSMQPNYRNVIDIMKSSIEDRCSGPIDKESFARIISKIRTDSALAGIFNRNVIEHITNQRNEILILCDKLNSYSEFLDHREVQFVCEISDLFLLRLWNGPEANFSSRISMLLSSYPEHCYKMHKLSCDFGTYVLKKVGSNRHDQILNE